MAKDIQTKREREKETVSEMIALYCRKQHGGKNGMCEDCAKLNEYARLRSDKCPFMEKNILFKLQGALLQAGNERKDSTCHALFRTEDAVYTSDHGDSACDRIEERKKEIRKE